MHIDNLEKGWKNIMKSIPIEMTKQLVNFITYFVNVWIIGKHGNNFSPLVWNQHACIGNHTNNQLEGFHSQLNKDLDTKPSIYTVIRHFKTIDSQQTNKYLRIKNGVELQKSKKTKKDREKDERLAQI